MTDEQQRFEDYMREVHAAFEKALASGRLSRDENANNFVGDGWMYMGPRADGRDVFKHKFTRDYLA